MTSVPVKYTLSCETFNSQTEQSIKRVPQTWVYMVLFYLTVAANKQASMLLTVLWFHWGVLTMVQDLLWSIMKHQHIQHISSQTLSSRCKTIIDCQHIHHDHIQIWSGVRSRSHWKNVCAVCLLLGNFVTIPLWPSDPAKSSVTVPVSHLYACAYVCVIWDDGETAA